MSVCDLRLDEFWGKGDLSGENPSEEWSTRSDAAECASVVNGTTVTQ